jgi:hypothetical protein
MEAVEESLYYVKDVFGFRRDCPIYLYSIGQGSLKQDWRTTEGFCKGWELEKDRVKYDCFSCPLYWDNPRHVLDLTYTQAKKPEREIKKKSTKKKYKTKSQKKHWLDHYFNRDTRRREFVQIMADEGLHLDILDDENTRFLNRILRKIRKLPRFSNLEVIQKDDILYLQEKDPDQRPERKRRSGKK